MIERRDVENQDGVLYLRLLKPALRYPFVTPSGVPMELKLTVLMYSKP